MVPSCIVIGLHYRMRVMVYFNRVSDVAPRPNENPGGRRDVEERMQKLLAYARLLLAASKTRQCGRSRPCLPLERVAWLSGHYVAAIGFGQKGSLAVRECTG